MDIIKLSETVTLAPQLMADTMEREFDFSENNGN